ncbi:MAG TPA: family 43 glycosylhydrolase, partial [Chitinophagaceae bacterium]|nr:family 43 glycosylhydrolase [Chitinophagaceae bacterium]
LRNFKPGGDFEYRTMYKPVPEAIDTFYAEYTSSEKWSTFSNPLFTDKGADPWVAYKDGMYYFTYTRGGSIVLYATKKMSELKNSSPVTIWRPPSGTKYSRNIWAPELHFIDHRWYAYFAADGGKDVDHRMFVLENSSPDPLQGTWEFKGELKEPADQWAIDGTILEYKGQLYMIWSGKTNGTFPQDLYIAKMSNPYTLEGSRVLISTPDHDWEENGAPINEGPEILKGGDGNVFIIYSGSGYWKDDYCLGMLSLKPDGDPLNPADWTKSAQPLLEESAASGAYGTGHCGFFKSRDGSEDWIIYHARSYPNGGNANPRNPRIQKIAWNADGTPDFGTPVKINENMEAPSGEF